MAAPVHETDGRLSTEGGLLGITALCEEQTAITAASEAHNTGAVYDEATVEAALNALGTKINAIITALEAVGILAEN